MINYSEITDRELGERICNYNKRINELMAEISDYLDRTNWSQEQKLLIQAEYTALKTEIRKEAHDIQIRWNNRCRNTVAFRSFRDGIIEAAARGFDKPTNGSIDFRYFSAVEEARYKLTKYLPLNEWEKVAAGEIYARR